MTGALRFIADLPAHTSFRTSKLIFAGFTTHQAHGALNNAKRQGLLTSGSRHGSYIRTAKRYIVALPEVKLTTDDPIIRALFRHMRNERLTVIDMAGLTGIPRGALHKAAVGKQSLRLIYVHQALAVVGARLTVERIT